MKVLLIDVNCKNSSTGKIVYDLYTEVNKSGHTAAICYGRGSKINEPNIYKFSSNIEMYTHALLTRLTGMTGYFSYFATRNLIKFMDKFKPDVVHLHELHAYFVNIAPIVNYLKEKKIKTVWTFHCEFMYTGKCGYAYECEKWKSECGHCSQVKEYPSSLLFDFTKKMFKDKKRLLDDFNNLTIITPSKWLADRVKQSFLSDRDIRVIHNGIDTLNIFYPRDYGHLKEKHNITDEKIVLSVAPNLMSERKGGKWVIELAKLLKNEKIKFILIGVDDINEKFDENIIALGRTENQHVLAEYYSMADITVLTSAKETFSLVCAESLACGTPIVGFDSGAPREIAPEGYGIFVPYGEIEKMKNIIASIFYGKVNINSSFDCTYFVKENYSKKVMVDNYLDIYLEEK